MAIYSNSGDFATLDCMLISFVPDISGCKLPPGNYFVSQNGIIYSLEMQKNGWVILSALRIYFLIIQAGIPLLILNT